MSDIRKILNAINENSVSTTSGSVSSVSQPILTQSRIEEEKPELPKVLEYGMWENSALVTDKKIKDSRKKSKVVKDVYDKDNVVKEAKHDVAEAEKNPFKNPLGKALYSALSNEKKASPQQVQRNKERWAKRQSEKDVAEGSGLDQQAMTVADKLTSGRNFEKLQAMAHDSTVYRALDRYFAKNNIPENIYNRVANIVFKRINQQGVAEGSEDFKARIERIRATLTPDQIAASEKIMKRRAAGRGISNAEYDEFKKQQTDKKKEQGVTAAAGNKNPQWLYHATYRPLLKSIKAHGLGGDRAQAKWEDSKPGVVYLALDFNVAESYAESSDVVPEDWLDQIVILKIAASKLDKSRLFVDQNVQDNEGDTLEYHGVIPLSNISLYKKGVAEGIIDTINRGVKSVKRGLQGWGGIEDDPKTLVKRNKAYDTNTALMLRKGLDKAPDHSPAGLQKRVLDRNQLKLPTKPETIKIGNFEVELTPVLDQGYIEAVWQDSEGRKRRVEVSTTYHEWDDERGELENKKTREELYSDIKEEILFVEKQLEKNKKQGVAEDIASTRREVNLKKKVDKGTASPEQKKEYQELKAKNMGRTPNKKQDVAEGGVAGPKNCWPGYRKVGTKPGTGKNAGKRVNKCQKISKSK
jgi:type III secretion system FlhB-like substrate exporter